MLDEIISTILQILVFSFIPFLVYLITNKSARGFLDYVGLKRSTRKANFFGIIVSLLFALPVLALIFTNPAFLEIMTDPQSVTGRIRQMGLSVETILTIIVVALFKTALAEEILFRGFIAKRLIRFTNFQIGNIIQAILFGIVHAALFGIISRNILFLTLIFLVPAIGAYLTVVLNEKLAGGSILPGWIAHGMGNLIAYTVVGFFV